MCWIPQPISLSLLVNKLWDAPNITGQGRGLGGVRPSIYSLQYWEGSVYGICEGSVYCICERLMHFICEGLIHGICEGSVNGMCEVSLYGICDSSVNGICEGSVSGYVSLGFL